MFSSVVVFLTLAVSALATVSITQPVASSVLTAGQQTTIKWIDNGQSPSLTEFGNTTFALYVGNVNQQTLLQPIATYIDVAIASSVLFTPDATVGANGGGYFIRGTSQSYKDPSTGQYAEVFSASFTMTAMSGSFNATVQSEIGSQSTATAGSPSTATMQTVVASTSKSSASASASTSATAGSKNGAGKATIATGFVALVAMLIGVSLF